jgi:transcriptional regulator with XRE-family HTH domain
MSTSQNSTNAEEARVRDYDRLALKSMFKSLVWAAFQERKKKHPMLLQEFAEALGKDKAVVSRWFNGSPNWTLDTIADIARVLDVELKIEAVDRKTRVIVTPAGVDDRNHFNGPTSTPVRVYNQVGPANNTSTEIMKIAVG